MALMKVWNGSSWVAPFFAYPKVWNGSAWYYGKPRVWTGSEWLDKVALDAKSIGVQFADLSYNDTDPEFGAYSVVDLRYGYSTSIGGSSISSGTSVIYGTAINSVMWRYYVNPLTGENVEYFSVDISSASNSGWTSVSLNNGVRTFNRAAADSFSSGIWTWSTPNNPFDTLVGQTINCIFN